MADDGGRAVHSARNFDVDLCGESVGFIEVNGLGLELDYTGEVVGGRVDNVRLRRAVTGDLTLWSWVRRMLDGSSEPCTVRITLLDARRVPVCVWELARARPIKWNGPDLNAVGNDVAMEEVVLTADAVEFRLPRPARPRRPRGRAGIAGHEA